MCETENTELVLVTLRKFAVTGIFLHFALSVFRLEFYRVDRAGQLNSIEIKCFVKNIRVHRYKPSQTIPYLTKFFGVYPPPKKLKIL